MSSPQIDMAKYLGNATAQTVAGYFKKTAKDDQILRLMQPQIAAMLSYGGVPAAVLANYMDARAECAGRMTSIFDMVHRYADPTTGTTTPDPKPLPGFVLRAAVPSSTLGDAIGVADTASGGFRTLPAAQVVAPEDVLVLTADDVAAVDANTDLSTVLQQPPSTLGEVAVETIIFTGLLIAGILLSGYAVSLVIDSITGAEAKKAHEATEQMIQSNAATMWVSAQRLLAQCVGTVSATPTDEQRATIKACWVSIVEKMPQLLAAIPKHTPAPDGGLGFFGKILVYGGAIVGTAVVGFFAYKWWSGSRADKKQLEKEKREEKRELEKEKRMEAARAKARAEAPTVQVAGAYFPRRYGRR